MSDIKRIISTSLKTGSLIIFTKALGLVAQVSLAAKLGISALSDAYFLVLILPTFICNVMGSALGLSTIGLIKDKTVGLLVLGKAFIYLIIPLVFLTLFRIQIGEYSFSNSITYEKIKAFEQLSFFFWPLTALMCLSQIMSIWLNSRGHVLLVSTTPLLNSFVILGFIFFLGSKSALNLLIYSQIFSVLLELLLIVYFSFKYQILIITNNYFKKLLDVSILSKGVVFTTIGWALLSLSAPIEQFFAARYGGGTNTAIGLTNRLVVPFCAALSSLVSAVFLQKFASYFELKERSKYWGYYIKVCLFLFVLSLLTSLLAFIFSNQIIELAYGRGHFSSLDRENIVRLFNISVFIIPAQIIIALSFRAYAISDRSTLQAKLILGSITVQLFFNLLIDAQGLGVSIVASTLISNYALAMAYILFGVFVWDSQKK